MSIHGSLTVWKDKWTYNLVSSWFTGRFRRMTRMIGFCFRASNEGNDMCKNSGFFCTHSRLWIISPSPMWFLIFIAKKMVCFKSFTVGRWKQNSLSSVFCNHWTIATPLHMRLDDLQRAECDRTRWCMSDRPVTSSLPGKLHFIFAYNFDQMEEATLWHVIMKVQSPDIYAESLREGGYIFPVAFIILHFPSCSSFIVFSQILHKINSLSKEDQKREIDGQFRNFFFFTLTCCQLCLGDS